MIEVDNSDCMIPLDAVEIGAELHAILLAGQSAGKEITSDANGAPVLTDPPPIPMSVQIDTAKAKVRAARTGIFSTMSGLQSQAIADGDMGTAKQISSIQNQLKALPDIDLSACTCGADIDAAFLAAWKSIVDAAPAGVKGAFNGVFA